MNIKALIAIVAIASLLLGAAGGYVVRPLLRGTPPTGQFGNRPAGVRAGRVFGTVQSTADGRLTVSMPDGSSKIILINDSTTYQHITAGSAADVTNGAHVIVSGQSNQDGSTTAMSIQVVPENLPLPFGNRPDRQ